MCPSINIKNNIDFIYISDFDLALGWAPILGLAPAFAPTTILVAPPKNCTTNNI